MTVRAALTAAMLAATSLVWAMPCAQASPEQTTGALPHGGSYILDPDPTVAAATVGLWFRAPAAGYDNATPGIARLAATAAAVAPLVSGKSLWQQVHRLGGDLNVNVYADIVGVDAVVPSSAVRQTIADMTAAYFTPNIDDVALRTAQRDSAVLAVQQRYSADLTLQNLLFARLFASGPAHVAPLPDSVAALTRIDAAAAGAFAKRAFRSQNAVLALAGNVDASSLQAVAQSNGGAPPDAPFDSSVASAPASGAATGAVPGLGMAWIGPPIADGKADTALDFVADYLFRDGSGVVSKSVDSDKADTFLTGQFITLHDPGVMLVTLSGDDAAALAAARKRVLSALAALREPMNARQFAAAREAFLYHVAADTQTPQEQAENLGWYAAEGNAGYAPGSASGQYVRDAKALDPNYVAGVVRRYLNDPVIVTLVTAVPTKEPST